MNTKGFTFLKLLLAFFLFSIVSYAACAQTKNAFDKVATTQEARTQLTQMASPEGALNAFSATHRIKGEFVVDITLEGKGNVLTVFMVSASEDNIPGKNLLKDKLHALHFKNIRIPKKERIKFRHTLIF